MIFETKRLTLREMTYDDLPALRVIVQDEQTMYAWNGAWSEEETVEGLGKQLRAYKEDGFGRWAVVLKETGAVIGMCGLLWWDTDKDRVPEIGYLFNRAYWHNGYATEAAIACKEYAFNSLKFKEIFSIVRNTNIVSKNVAIRNGMTVRARFVKYYRGVDMPHFVLSATPPPLLESMNDFFTKRANIYDEYMLESVDGVADGYIEFAKHLPDGIETFF